MTKELYPAPAAIPATLQAQGPVWETPFGTYNPVGQFAPFQPTYCNHISVCFHPVDWTAYILQTWRLNGSGPFSLQIYRHPAPYTTLPELIRTWKQTVDIPGPFGYGSIACLPDGSAYLGVPGGMLESNKIQPSIRIEPGICSPFAATGWGNHATSGGGAGAPSPILYPVPLTAPVWENRPLTTGVLVDIPSVFHCAVAPAYLVRFCAVAPLGGVRARAGSEAAPFILTVNTQAPNVEIHGQGWVPGPQCFISPAQGTPNVWFQIVGYAA